VTRRPTLPRITLGPVGLVLLIGMLMVVFVEVMLWLTGPVL
jgi:hypothetical protein